MRGERRISQSRLGSRMPNIREKMWLHLLFISSRWPGKKGAKNAVKGIELKAQVQEASGRLT